MHLTAAPSLATGCRGVALVITLWMLALLSVIAGTLVFSTRTDLQVAGNVALSARAEAIADAGVYKAIHELVSAPPGDPLRWQGNGQVHPWEFGGGRLALTIIDEASKVDINTAADELMRGLLLSLGVANEQAVALVDAIQDWRDADDLRRLNGAEKDDYVSAGRKYGPANGNFESIDELRQVLGVDDRLFRLLEPLITVHSGQTWVNAASAARQILLAIPGATPAIVDAFIEQRQAALTQGLSVPPFALAPLGSTSSSNSTVSIQVDAVLGDNIRFFREAVVRLTGDAANPVTILAWRTSLLAGNAAAATGPVAEHPLTVR